MLVRLGDRCGIAEHSGYFFAHLSPGLAKSYAQDPYSKDHGALLSRLMADDVRLVHVQYETALFRDTPALARLLASLQATGVKVIMDLHSVPTNGAVLDVVDTVDCVIVHGQHALDILKERAATMDNSRFLPLALPTVELDPVLSPIQRPSEFTVGTFGFIARHKGIVAACRSIKALHKEGLPISLVVVGSAHPMNAQDAEYLELKRMENEVPWLHLVDEFLSVEESVAALAQCDALVFNYMVDSSSGSGAAPLAALAGRPLVLSESKMLRGIPGIVYGYNHNPKLEVALRKLWVNKSLRERLGKEARAWAIERSGAIVAKQYETLYDEILAGSFPRIE